jgi:RES domain-containing protein
VRIWRISNYADLSGRGGLLADGRWNRMGTSVVYCSDHPATTLLEALARIDRFDVPATFRLLAIGLPDDAPTTSLNAADLPSNWRTDTFVTQALGTELLNRVEHLAVHVPCVLVPYASNVLLNPRHPDAARCSIVETVESAFDPRLIR